MSSDLSTYVIGVLVAAIGALFGFLRTSDKDRIKDKDSVYADCRTERDRLRDELMPAVTNVIEVQRAILDARIKDREILKEILRSLGSPEERKARRGNEY